MQKIYLALCLCIGATVGFGQAKIHSETHSDDSKPRERTEIRHFYAPNGLSETIEEWFYARPDSAPRLLRRRLLGYDNNKRLLSDESNGTTQLSKKRVAKTRYLVLYTYNSNGCQTRWQSRYFEDDTLIRQRTIDATVNAKCQIAEENLTQNGFDRSLKQFYFHQEARKIFTYDAKDSLIYIKYIYSARDSGFVKWTRRPSDGLTVEWEELNNCDFCVDVIFHSRWVLTYDSAKRLQTRLWFYNEKTLANPSWRFSDSTHSTYEKGRLVRETTFHRYFGITRRYQDTSFQKYAYDLYCDGLVRQKTSIYGYNGYGESSPYRILYKYTEGATCAPVSEKKVKIYPNPANFRSTIETDALFTANFKALIVNHLGQEVARFDIDFRTPFFDFSTQNLPNGHYVVKLWNGEKILSQKLVVAH